MEKVGEYHLVVRILILFLRKILLNLNACADLELRTGVSHHTHIRFTLGPSRVDIPRAN